jgi:hypothetical protein
MLPTQAKRDGIAVPGYFYQFINIKHWYEFNMQQKAWGMSNMLEKLGLTLDGKHHSGIDDCRNITKLCKVLIERGVNLQTTFDLKLKKNLIDFATSKWTHITPNVQISLIERPSRKDVEQLVSENCTHIVSILHPTKDGPKKTGRIIQDNKIEWMHVPVSTNPLFAADRSTEEFKSQFEHLQRVIQLCQDAQSNNKQVKIAFHCTQFNARAKSPSHRSTLFAFAVMKGLGIPDQQAIEKLRETQWRQVQDDVGTTLPESKLIDSLFAEIESSVN